MARAGQIIEDPITKQLITFLKTARDTGGELLRIEVRMAPGGFMPIHMHPMQQERLDLISGTLRLSMGARELSIIPGQVVVIERGEAHEARNEGDEEALFVIEARPALKLETGLQTMFGLARDGRANRRGRPRNPLQLAVLAREYRDEVAVPGIPLFVQRAMVLPLAAIGRLSGLRPSYPRYSDGQTDIPQ